MMLYVKEPHTNIFTGPTRCGKICLVLVLIEKEKRIQKNLYIYVMNILINFMH